MFITIHYSECFLAKIGFDTAKDEASTVWYECTASYLDIVWITHSEPRSVDLEGRNANVVRMLQLKFGNGTDATRAASVAAYVFSIFV